MLMFIWGAFILYRIFITSKKPEQFIELLWNIFFVSKSRGIKISVHFPWIEWTDDKSWYVVLFDNQRVIGCLVVRDVSSAQKHGIYKVASIGMVCIDPIYRGLGHVKTILDAAINEAKIRGYDALTLWTQKHDVYTRQGFKLMDDSVFGSVDMTEELINDIAAEESVDAIIAEAFPHELGIPPFALSGEIFHSVNAKIFLLKDKAGLILADWVGNEIEIAMMLKNLPKKKLRVNAHQNDQLLCILKMQGAKLDFSLSNLQMWLPLSSRASDANWLQEFRFSVLDRI